MLRLAPAAGPRRPGPRRIPRPRFSGACAISWKAAATMRGGNLDDLIGEATAQFPQDNFLRVFRYYVENYKVYYVLNQFNSVAESVENTIKPFVEEIFRTASSRVTFHNLGWVVEDEQIRRSGETGVPYMVRRHYQKKQAAAPLPELGRPAARAVRPGAEESAAGKEKGPGPRAERPARPAAQDLRLQRRQGPGDQPGLHRRPRPRPLRQLGPPVRHEAASSRSRNSSSASSSRLV